jgi:hypothetical protein
MLNGRRHAGGRPKGSKSKTGKALDREVARAALRAAVIAKIGPLVESQIANAMGLKYLVVRDKRTGKFLRVSEAMAKSKAKDGVGDNEVIEVWEKDPSVQAFTDLMNRTIDRPPESVELNQTGSSTITIKWES